MSQENFDDLLKQSFEKERDIPFDESAWHSLSGRLNSSRGFMLPLWSILLLSLGWLAAAGLGVFMISAYADSASPSEAGLDYTAKNSAMKLYPCDTIYQQPDTIIIKDTIFLYPSAPKTNARANSNTIKAVASDNTQITTPVAVQKIAPQIIATSIADNNLLVSSDHGSIPPLPSVPTINNVVSDRLPVDWLYKESIPTIMPQKPGRFQIGITAGWGNILQEEDNVFAALLGSKFQNDDAFAAEVEFDSNLVQQHLAPSGVLQQGINISYRLNNYFIAQAEFGQERISYQYKNSLVPSGFDLLYDEARLNAEANSLLSQRSFYYEIGFQAQLPKRLSPILQTSLRMRSHLNSITLKKLEQEAESSNTGAYILSLPEANKKNPSKGLRVEQIRLGAGLQYQISRDWAVQSSVNTYMDVRDDGWVRPDWALNVGLKYRLPAKKSKP